MKKLLLETILEVNDNQEIERVVELNGKSLKVTVSIFGYSVKSIKGNEDYTNEYKLSDFFTVDGNWIEHKDDRLTLFYRDISLGKILTNYSMSIEDVIESLEIDIYAKDENGNELYSDYEDFRLV